MRKRCSRVYKQKKGDAPDEIEQLRIPTGTSIKDIPDSILTKIILKLQTKEIVFSKCVCKTWYRLISDPQFVKLHFAQAMPIPLIRTFNPTHVSRTFFLIETPEIIVTHCCCNGTNCSKHDPHMKLETKLKVPLRNPDLLLNSDIAHPNSVSNKRKRCVKVKPRDQKINIVNSCNGFICLSEPSTNEPVVVCNPVTGEYINLPLPHQDVDVEHRRCIVDCGFGFCSKTAQYKVIRMTYQGPRKLSSCPITGKEGYYNKIAEIHTLGTDSWKRVGYAPCSVSKLPFPTYVNGSLYWLLRDGGSPSPYMIASFDFSTEQFRPISLPFNHTEIYVNPTRVCLGVLKGCLCICDSSMYAPIDIWVMKENGLEKVWSKIVSFDNHGHLRWPLGIYQPLGFLKDGAILLFNYPYSSMLYYHPKTQKCKYFEIQGVKSRFEAIAHIPTFLSLKTAIQGDDTMVLNIGSRCAKYKLPGESKAVNLVKVGFIDVPCYSDSDDEKYWHKLW